VDRGRSQAAAHNFDGSRKLTGQQQSAVIRPRNGPQGPRQRSQGPYTVPYHDSHALTIYGLLRRPNFALTLRFEKWTPVAGMMPTGVGPGGCLLGKTVCRWSIVWQPFLWVATTPQTGFYPGSSRDLKNAVRIGFFLSCLTSKRIFAIPMVLIPPPDQIVLRGLSPTSYTAPAATGPFGREIRIFEGDSKRRLKR